MTPACRRPPDLTGRRLALRLALLALVAAALGAGRAAADDKLRQSEATWRAMDNCARAAIKAYPDYTAEALAKRETERRLCLRRGNLPGGGDAPTPVTAGSGDVSK